MPSSGGGSNYKYGSVGGSAGDEEQRGDDFKETDLLYYKGRTLSQKEKTAKLVKIAVPVVIAVLLIGGLTWFLLGDFGHLYPGPSGPPASSPDIPAAAPKVPSSSKSHAAESEPASSPTSKTRSSSSSSAGGGGRSACSAHSKCSTLGLIGDCCPTTDGEMLECCS